MAAWPEVKTNYPIVVSTICLLCRNLQKWFFFNVQVKQHSLNAVPTVVYDQDFNTVK